jgi:hypothetical protein
MMLGAAVRPLQLAMDAMRCIAAAMAASVGWSNYRCDKGG